MLGEMPTIPKSWFKLFSQKGMVSRHSTRRTPHEQ